MKFLEKIKRFLFGDISPTTENFKAENNISRIDLSHIEINRDLSEEEMFLKRSFSQEIAQGDINSLIKYGEDMAKEINYYLEISRKIINQNLVLSSPSNKSLNINDAIKQKVRISFNMSEINSIIEDLQRIKRESEIRLLALEEAQDLELNAASRKVFFFCNKRDVTRLKSIQTAISRISTTVSVITSVLQSIKIEYYASLKDNTALDNIISQNNPEENIEIANNCLNDLYYELLSKIDAIDNLNNSSNLENFRGLKETPKEQVEQITKMKAYIDLYVEENQIDFFKKGGHFDKAKKLLESLSEEIESDYYDWDVWYKNNCKEIFGEYRSNFFYNKYSDKFNSLFNIIEVFGEYVPINFKEKLYKTNFLRFINSTQEGKAYFHRGEEEVAFYCNFISDMISDIYTSSTDIDVINFMDKYIKPRSPKDIFFDKDKTFLIALCRVHSLGKYGLYTLKIFPLFSSNRDLFSLDGVYAIGKKVRNPLFYKLQVEKHLAKPDKIREHQYALKTRAKLDIYSMWYKEMIISKPSHIDLRDFAFAQLTHDINKKVRLDQSKPENLRLWNTANIFLKVKGKNNVLIRKNIGQLIYNFRNCIPAYREEIFSDKELINKLTNVESFRTDDTISSHIYYSDDGKTFISLSGKNDFKPGRMDYTEFMDKMLSVYIIQLLTLQKYNFVYNGIYVGNPNKEEQMRNNPSSDDILKQNLISGIIDFFKYESHFIYSNLFAEGLSNLKSEQLDRRNRNSKYRSNFAFSSKCIDFYLSTIAVNQFMGDEQFNRISLLFTPDLVHLIIDNRQMFDEYLKKCKADINHNENENPSMIFAKYSINPCKEIIKLYREERDL